MNDDDNVKVRRHPIKFGFFKKAKLVLKLLDNVLVTLGSNY